MKLVRVTLDMDVVATIPVNDDVAYQVVKDLRSLDKHKAFDIAIRECETVFDAQATINEVTESIDKDNEEEKSKSKEKE